MPEANWEDTPTWPFPQPRESHRCDRSGCPWSPVSALALHTGWPVPASNRSTCTTTTCSGIRAHDRHAVVHAVTAAISIIATVAAAVVAVIVLNLTQAGFQAQIGADQQVGRAIVVQRAQTALIQRIAHRFGDLRRIRPRGARRQLPVEPGPTAITPVITRRRRVGAAVKGVGGLRRRRRQGPRLRHIRVAALAGSQPQTDQQ